MRRILFLAALTRYPTEQEMAVISKNKRGTRDAWLADLQWAILNKVDFLVQH